MVSNDDFDGKATHLNCFYLHINFEQIYPKPAIVITIQQLLTDQKLNPAKRKLERLNFQLHHRLSKFEVPVVVNLKHIFELFGLYTTCFLI